MSDVCGTAPERLDGPLRAVRVRCSDANHGVRTALSLEAAKTRQIGR